MRILLVEDQLPLVKALRQGFEEEGFAVDTATDGEEADVKALFARLGIPHTSINTVSVAMEQPAIRDRLPTTTLPDGRTVRMTPPAVTVPGTATHLRFPPRYGEHTDAVLAEIGYGAADIATLRAQGAIA